MNEGKKNARAIHKQETIIKMLISGDIIVDVIIPMGAAVPKTIRVIGVVAI